VPSAIAMGEFLAQGRIAVVGVSRDSTQFANSVLRALRERGCDAIPVNPHAATLEGVTAYPRVQSVPGGVDGVILVLPPDALPGALDDCLAARAPRIWFRSTGAHGAAPDLVNRARAGGAEVIDGGCPFMVLSKAGWFHHAHGTFARWTGAVQP
jgi:predicted CoA-binding protein